MLQRELGELLATDNPPSSLSRADFLTMHLVCDVCSCHGQKVLLFPSDQRTTFEKKTKLTVAFFRSSQWRMQLSVKRRL
jgi:hypothetical protein